MAPGGGGPSGIHTCRRLAACLIQGHEGHSHDKGGKSQVMGFLRKGRITAAAFAGAGLIAGGVTVALPAMSPQAATTYVCKFSGQTTSLTPIAAPPKTGGTGSYSFSGSATCVSGTKTINSTINSTGTYTNTVCGTGTATGTASFSAGPASISYTITFVNGVGSLKVTGGGSGNGAVDIVPSNTGGCATKAVTGFKVTGVQKLSQ